MLLRPPTGQGTHPWKPDQERTSSTGEVPLTPKQNFLRQVCQVPHRSQKKCCKLVSSSPTALTSTQPTAPFPGHSKYSESLWNQTRLGRMHKGRTVSGDPFVTSLPRASCQRREPSLGLCSSPNPCFTLRGTFSPLLFQAGTTERAPRAPYGLHCRSPAQPRCRPRRARPLSPGPEHEVRRGQAVPHGPGGRAEQAPGRIAQVAAPGPGGPGATAA